VQRSDFLKTAGLGIIPSALLKKNSVESRELIKPKRLKPGDTVAFTAPAGLVRNRSDFQRMQRAMESLGLNVKFGEFVREGFGYLAGRDYQRALDLNRFFSDPEVDAIIAVRGGWGCARILPHIDFERVRKHPKIFCGFSDITTLHLSFLKECGLITFHGPNGASEWTDLTTQSFKRVLMEGAPAVFQSKSSTTVIRGGAAEGRLIGGNLTILTTSLGTSYQPDTENAILFVEDIGEPPYKVDRMLTHLARAGILEKITGFVFGQCTNCPETTDTNFTLWEILSHHIRPLGVPAVMGVDIGHDDDNFTIPMGVEARLDANTGIISLKERAVV
jgi:muramoyltetrapeptide carboxypeptidase